MNGPIPIRSKSALRDALQSQLKFLNARMAETAQTANQFLGKFLFGGLVAVIALLNVDLVVIRDPVTPTRANLPVLGAIAVVILIISGLYFSTVVSHYRGFRVSHRKLKYKYELTMHALLGEGERSEYAELLEESVDQSPDKGFKDQYPSGGDFETIGRYFLNHHRKAWEEKLSQQQAMHSDPFFRIAMLLVLLTLAVRLMGLLLAIPSSV